MVDLQISSENFARLEAVAPEEVWRHHFRLRLDGEALYEGLLVDQVPDSPLLQIHFFQDQKKFTVFPSFESAEWLFRLRKSQHAKESLRDILKKSESKSVVDLSGGWGVDSFMMAFWGFRVKTFEKDPLLYFFLDQAWRSFQSQYREWAVGMEWELCFGDSFQHLGTPGTAPADTFYFDPMFAEKNKKVKHRKEIELLSLVNPVAPDNQEIEQNIAQILSQQPQTLIVKRSVHAIELPNFAGYHHYTKDSSVTQFHVFRRGL